jgi:hypothetical protein
MVIRFGKQRQAGRVPDDLIDPNYLPGASAIIVTIVEPSSSKPDEKHRVAVHGAHIDGAIKRNRESWLEIKSIKLI